VNNIFLAAMHLKIDMLATHLKIAKRDVHSDFLDLLLVCRSLDKVYIFSRPLGSDHFGAFGIVGWLWPAR
jgi:hypothetical protein